MNHGTKEASVREAKRAGRTQLEPLGSQTHVPMERQRHLRKLSGHI
jgi:hypothetical protein